MTTKVRVIKFLHDHHEAAQSPLKRTPLRPAMLYLMELRSHFTDAHLPKKKHVIPIEPCHAPEVPQDIAIVNLTAPAESPVEATLLQIK